MRLMLRLNFSWPGRHGLLQTECEHIAIKFNTQIEHILHGDPGLIGDDHHHLGQINLALEDQRDLAELRFHLALFRRQSLHGFRCEMFERQSEAGANINAAPAARSFQIIIACILWKKFGSAVGVPRSLLMTLPGSQ